MWKFWKSSLALSLGLMASSACGQEGGWQTTPTRPGESNRESIAPVQPIGLAAPSTTSNRSPAATLQRPIPVYDSQEGAAGPDPSVQPTAFRGVFGLLNDTPASDAPLAKPLPAATIAPGTLSARSWRRADDQQNPEKINPPKESADSTSGSPTILPPPSPTGVNAPFFIHGIGSNVGCAPCDAAVTDGCFCDGAASSCCPGNKFYATTEYLLWWVKGSPLPALVTQGSLGDTIPGALGQPGTMVLYGNNAVGSGPRSGGRFMLGYWFGEQHCLGLEAGGFFLGNRTPGFSATSNGSPILTRPFTDAVTGVQTVELVAGPNALAGTISITNRSSFWGYETNLRSNVCCCPHCYTDFILGFRALGLDENLNINEQLTVLRSPGGSFVLNDQFNARNRFYGGQIGTVTQYQYGNWSFDFLTKIGLGATHQTVNINGSTTINDPVNGQSQNVGGLLAQRSNIGRFSRDMFGVVPEVGLNIGYQLTDHCRCYLGYNIIYWSNVVRPGNQIDPVVNTAQLPPAQPGGPARPAFSFRGSDFWAQGINVGLEFRY